MPELLDYLREEPFPSKFAMVRFFTECVHHSWPNLPKEPPRDLSPAEAERYAMSNLDAEIRQMEATVQSVYSGVQEIVCARRRHRNTLVAVSRLPPEVLFQIFAWADNGNVRVKLNLAQTCSSWRTLILNYPVLWTSIDMLSVTRPQFVPSILKRAKGLSVQLSYTNWERLNEEKADYCATLMPNIDTLRLKVGTRYVKHSGTWLAQCSAPKLRRLDLAMSGGIAIFPRLFGNKRPCLRELTLTNCRLAWAPGMYTGITRLKIQSHYVMQSTDTSDRDIRQVFRDCPTLEELELVNCGPVYDTSLVGLPDMFPLPRLRLLNLQLHVEEAGAILACIQPPPTVHIVLYCNTSGPTPALVASSHLGVLSEFRSLELDGAACTATGFRDLEGHAEAFALTLYGDRAPGVFDPFVRALGARHQHPLLRRLRAHALAGDALEGLLRGASGLTHLELECDAGVLTRLAAGAPALQRLEALALEGVQLDGDALLEVSDVLLAAPRLRFLCLCRCNTALSRDEVVALFAQDVETVKWTDESLEGYDLTDDYPDEVILQQGLSA